MNKLTRSVFTLVLAMALALPVFTGCGGKPSATPAEQDLPQILDDAVSAVENAGSYKFVIETDSSFAVNTDSEEEDMSATMNITGTANLDDSEMQISYDMNLSGYLFEDEEGLEAFHGEIYILADWTYKKTDMPGDDQWIKIASDVSFDQYNVIVIELTLLELPENIEFIGFENFDGSECYVVKVIANPENTETWFYNHQMTANAIYWPEVEPYAGELAFTVWVDTDTSLIKKMDASMLIDFDDPADVPDFDTMTLDVAMVLSDYNKPVTITLPDEARDAEEVTV